MLISGLHNLSRSMGVALLATGGGSDWVLIFVGGETSLFLLNKIVRNDFYHWVPLDALFAIISSSVVRVLVKIIVDYSGCIHFRHP